MHYWAAGTVLLEEGEGRACDGLLLRAVSHGKPGGCHPALSSACYAGSFQRLAAVDALHPRALQHQGTARQLKDTQPELWGHSALVSLNKLKNLT